MTPIKGYAEILRRRDVPDDKRVRFATGIFDASKRLERIIELLVDFAAMEAGRLAPKRSALDVGVTVEDEGIGIPAPDLQKAFSEFRQIDGSETRAYGGLGLGLSFARRIVEAHGGRLSIESEEGRGTRVTMTFPAAGQKPLPAGAGWDESEPVVAGREDGAE